MLQRTLFLLAALSAALPGQSNFDPAVFKNPPARYRGHASAQPPRAELKPRAGLKPTFRGV